MCIVIFEKISHIFLVFSGVFCVDFEYGNVELVTLCQKLVTDITVRELLAISI